MAADGASTVESAFFHPQHSLARQQYSEESTHPCAACERAVTGGGAGYSCAECGFHIHEACLLALPESIAFDQHAEHPLTLTRLRATRRCGLCKETSDAGSYMYQCAQCDLDVHPRCTTLLDGDAGADATQPRRRSRTRRAIKVGLKIGMFGFRVADLVTGGFTSPVLDVVGVVIDNLGKRGTYCVLRAVALIVFDIRLENRNRT